MTEPQKKAAAVVALILIVLPTLILVWQSIAVLGPSSLGDHQPGKFILGVAAGGDGIKNALKVLPMVIAVGLSFLIPRDGLDWRFIASIAALLVGLLCSVFLYISFQADDTAWRMWSYSVVSTINSPEALHAALDTKLLVFAGWYLSMLAAQIGIKMT